MQRFLDGLPGPGVPMVTELEDSRTWAGLLGSMPVQFVVGRMVTSWGFMVASPVVVSGPRVVLDAARLLDLHPDLCPAAKNIFFEPMLLPVPGWALREIADSDDAAYRSPVRREVEEVATYLARHGHGGRTIVPVPADPPVWFVCGPPAGQYLSSLHWFASEERAARYAQRRTAEASLEFRVRRLGEDLG